MEVAGLHIGNGRARLLEKIKEQGSISKAAQSLKISYRQAWAMVNEMNQGAKKKIVIKPIGGSSGGGTILTTESVIFEKKDEKSKEEDMMPQY